MGFDPTILLLNVYPTGIKNSMYIVKTENELNSVTHGLNIAYPLDETLRDTRTRRLLTWEIGA